MDILASWPVALFALGVVFFLVFKQPICRLIDRVRRVGVGNTGIDAASGTQTGGVASQLSAADELLKTFDNALLLQREEEIRREFEKNNLAQGSDRDRVLIRFLAGLSITLYFERTYSIIWGSQIGVLEILNQFRESGVEIEIFRHSYEQAAVREPNLYRDYTFEGWLGFMVDSRLINRRGTKVYITLEGTEFLKYLVHQGFNLYKRG